MEFSQLISVRCNIRIVAHAELSLFVLKCMEREGVIGPANAMGKRDVFGRRPDEHG